MSSATRLRCGVRLLPLVLLAVEAAPAVGFDDAVVPGPDQASQPWRVTSFLADASLGGRGIFHLDFEPDGTVWIAASDGLYRYDGYRWDRYTTSEGLPSNYVRCVRVTRDGRLWVGTDRGAVLFDGGRFDPAGTEGHLAGPSVRRIVEDPDGTLWFCCDEWPPADVPSGLTRYRDGKWTTWRAEDGLPSDYVSDVFTDSRGRHFILTRGGLALFEGQRLRRPLEEAGLPGADEYIWSVVESREGSIVALTRDWIFVHDGERWRRVPNGPARIVTGGVGSTREGKIFACTSGADARILEWRDDHFAPLRTAPLDTSGGVQFVGEAPDGAIWIAGSDTLVRWERSGGEWQRFEGLPAPQIRDAEGGIWFGEAGRVLRRFGERWIPIPDARGFPLGDGSGGVWLRAPEGLTHWTSDGRDRFDRTTIGIGNLETVSVDGSGALWVIGRDPGGETRLASFDGERWSQRALGSVRPTETVVVATPDPADGMWYVLEDEEADTFRILRVTGANTVDVPIPNATRRYWNPRVQPDHTGRVWLFGKFGLYERDPGAEGWQWRPVPGLPGRGLSSAVPRGRATWFSYLGVTGGRGGVSRYLDGAWKHYSSQARDLTRTGQDDGFFFTHPRGVYVLAGDSRDEPRLLVLPEPVAVRSVVSAADGELWFGSDAGVFRFRPDGIPPETLIMEGERNLFLGEDLSLRVRGVERFKPWSRAGGFDVAVRLDDRPWSEFEPLSDGRVVVSGVGVGSHVVRIRLRDQGLDVDPTPATWRFRLRPIPLQDRAWFGPLATAVFLSVLVLAILSVVARRREHAQRMRKHELEREILHISEREQRRIGQDLHDGLGQRLTSISFQCKALSRLLDSPASERAAEIGTEVRTAISETRALAHALYPAEIDREDLDTALGYLVDSIDRTFEGTCEYRHEWMPDDLDREDALNVYRLVQEALANAVRHAAAATLHVESRRDGTAWVVEVRDDGRGFHPAHPAGRGLGLQIMRYRAELIGGALSVSSRIGSGTTVRCRVPLRRSPGQT